MKKLIVLAIVLMASTAFAGKLAWDVEGEDGCILFYRTLGAAEWTEIDVGKVKEYNIDNMGLEVGQRYEFKLQAYVGDPRSFSGDSDTLRWTYPRVSVVIELPDTPQTIIFNFGD